MYLFGSAALTLLAICFFPPTTETCAEFCILEMLGLDSFEFPIYFIFDTYTNAIPITDAGYLQMQ